MPDYKSRVIYPNLTGVRASFPVPFPFLSRSFVAVFYIAAGDDLGEGTLVSPSAYEWNTDGLITFKDAPSGTVIIRRSTPTAPLTKFAVGTIAASTLNTATTQVLHVAEEEADARAELGARTFVVPRAESGNTLPTRLQRALQVLSFDGTGRAVTTSIEALARALAAPLRTILGAIYKGDPGGYVGGIGLFLALGGMSFPPGVDNFTTSGYRKTGVGAGDYTRHDPTNTAHPTLAARGKGIWWDTDQDGARWFLSSTSKNVFQFGAYGEGSVDPSATVPDDLPAFLAIDDYVNDTGVVGFSDYSGGVFEVPEAVYYWSDCPDLRASYTLNGPATGFDGNASAIICTAVDKPAFVVTRANTVGTIPDFQAGPVTAANGAMVRGIAFFSQGTTLYNNDGAVLRARARLEGCTFRGYGGNGIRVEAESAGAPYLKGNANLAQIINCTTIINGEHGVSVRGDDANVLLVIGLNSRYNGRFGAFDGSFLGCFWMAGHTEGNGHGTSGYNLERKRATICTGLDGRRYYLVYGMEALAAATDPVSGSRDVWRPVEGVSGADPAGNIVWPAWGTPGVTWVTGGARYGNGNEQFLYYYSEGGEGPSQARGFQLGGTQGAGVDYEVGSYAGSAPAMGYVHSGRWSVQHVDPRTGRSLTQRLFPNPGAGFVRVVYDTLDPTPASFQWQEILPGNGYWGFGYNQTLYHYVSGPYAKNASFLGLTSPRAGVTTHASLSIADEQQSLAREVHYCRGGVPPATAREGGRAIGTLYINDIPAVGKPAGFMVLGANPDGTTRYAALAALTAWPTT